MHSCEKPAASGWPGEQWICPACGAGWYALADELGLFISWERTSWPALQPD